MRSRSALLVGVLLSLAASLPAVAAVSAEPPEEVLDEALVIGDQPGPGLWKITRGDNVLWILGSTRNVPARANWRAEKVQARVAESQELLYPPVVNVYPSIGVLRIITLLPRAIGIEKNPDGETLQQVLPPALYTRWQVLRDKYFVPSKTITPKFLRELEHRRPGLVAMELLGMAAARSGLSRGLQVDMLVQKTAREHQVPLRRPPTLDRAVKVEDIGRMLKEGRRKVPQSELDCFARMLDNVEASVESARVRANAWARGDIAKLRELARTAQPRNEDCIYSMITGYTQQDSKTAAKARKILADFEWHEQQGQAQSQRDWVVAARAALEKNRSTFAVLPIDDVLRADGHLESMRALGYTVEEPL